MTLIKDIPNQFKAIWYSKKPMVKPSTRRRIYTHIYPPSHRGVCNWYWNRRPRDVNVATRNTGGAQKNMACYIICKQILKVKDKINKYEVTFNRPLQPPGNLCKCLQN